MRAPIDFAALSLDQARELWLKHLKLPLPQHRSRDLMVRALSYHLQARTDGGLTQTLRRKLDDLAPRFAANRDFAPAAAERAKPGSVLVRAWNGVNYAVTVTDTGFLYDGKLFASLTAVALAITGTHLNGPHFFRLTNGAREA
ncbi:MAG: DUF2924 domain-containing protein [Vitreimonas sp.]